MSDLLISQIIQPLGLEEFCGKYWGRRYLRIQGRGSDFNEQFVPARDIEDAIAAPGRAAWHFTVYRDGIGVPIADYSEITHDGHLAIPARLAGFYAQGYSLVFLAAHCCVTSVERVCARLTDEFGFPVRANVYKTPAAATGFVRHGDLHEVLVLQVSGRKRWRVWGPDGMDEFDLQAGDTLYLPRGVEHAPYCVDSESVHITVRMHPNYGYGPLPGHGDERFPLRAEPPAFASPEEKAAFHHEFGEVGALTGSSVVRRSPSTQIVIRNLGATVQAESPDGSVAVPAFLEASVEFALSGKEFRVDELPGMLPEPGKVKIMELFLKKGLLSLVRI